MSGLSGVILAVRQPTVESEQHDPSALEDNASIPVRKIPKSFRVYGERAQDGDRVGSQLRPPL